MKRSQKKVLAIAACAAVAAGIGVSLAFIFKSGNGGNTLPESSSAIVADNSSVDSGTDSGIDTTIEENVDIYKSHSYPELADEDMITLSQLAENREAYEDNIMSEDYGNIVFTARPDIFVPDEIGKYQMQYLDEYFDNAEEVIKYFAGDEFDESKIMDYRKMEDPIFYPISIHYEDGEYSAEDKNIQISGIYVSVGNTGQVLYVDEMENNDMYIDGLSDVTEEKTYFLQADYTDETYSFGENDLSISQYAKIVDDCLDNVLSLLDHKGGVGQIAIVTQKDESGNMYMKSEMANFYKQLPITPYFPMSSIAKQECILKETKDSLFPLDAVTTNGSAVQELNIQSLLKDYKTIEEYDKIVAPDKAAKLLSDKLAPNLQDNEIIGMGLSYYPYFVGDPVDEETGEKQGPIYELTPFWTFYFDLDPSVIGLVDCKTGEVAYIHNVP